MAGLVDLSDAVCSQVAPFRAVQKVGRRSRTAQCDVALWGAHQNSSGKTTSRAVDHQGATQNVRPRTEVRHEWDLLLYVTKEEKATLDRSEPVWATVVEVVSMVGFQGGGCERRDDWFIMAEPATTVPTLPARSVRYVT